MDSWKSADDELSRAWLRRRQAKKIIYDAGPLHHQESPDDTRVHTYALKLMAGIHFPTGAEYLSNATKPALAVASTLFNAMKHLEAGAKRDFMYADRSKNMTGLASAPLYWHVVTHQLVIPSVPDPVTNVATCAGIMIMWTVTEVGGGGGGGGAAGAAAPAVGGEDAAVDDAAADAGAPAAGATSRRRKGPYNPVLLDKARKSPISVGLARHFAEVRYMKKEVARRRALYVTSNRTKQGPVTAELNAKLRIPMPQDTREYAYAAYDDMDSFVLEAVHPYFSVPTGMEATIPEHDPGNGFLEFSPGSSAYEAMNARVAQRLAGTRLDPGDYHVDSLSVIHPEFMFCPERMLTYFNRCLDVRVDPRACQLDEYFPGAQPRIPRHLQQQQAAAAANRRVAAAAPAAVPVRRAVIESSDHDDDDSEKANSSDDNDDEVLSEDDNAAVPPLPAAAAAADDDGQLTGDDNDDDDDALMDLRHYLYGPGNDQVGMPYNHMRCALPNFPFPRLVAQMNTQATYAEVASTIAPLFYIVGSKLPPAAFAALTQEDLDATRVAHVFPDDDPMPMTLALRAVVRLRIAENIMAPSANPLENETTTGLGVGTAVSALSAAESAGAARFMRSAGQRRVMRDGVVVQEPVQVQAIIDVNDTTMDLATLIAREPLATRDLAPIDPAVERQQFVENGASGIPADLLHVQTHQTKVVRATIGALAARFKLCEYAELKDTFTKAPVVPSTHKNMPLSEFYVPSTEDNTHELTQLERIRRSFDAIKGSLKLTPEQERSVQACVDVTPQWQIDRNELLAKRPQHQMARGLLNVTQQAERDAIIADMTIADDKTRLRKLAHMDDNHLRYRHDMQVAGWHAFFETWEKTTMLSPAVLAVRDYILNHAKPMRDKTVVKTIDFDARTYALVRQFYTDSYRSGELVTKQNLTYMERAHTCGHHCMRWFPRRTDPALNYTIVGGSGAGKSFALLITESMTPNGVVSDTTNETTNAYNVDQDFDGHIVLYQELDSNLLFSARNKNDAGSSDKINFAKARMTSFFTRVKFFKSDDATGKRTAADCFSSQHIVTIGATNQDVSKMDVNMKRRLLIDNISESPAASEGNHTVDQKRQKDGAGVIDLNISEQVRNEHRELFGYYATMEAAIKMGVTEDFVVEGASAFLTAILKDATAAFGIDGNNKGHKTWILEVARILAMQDMCYKSLFSTMVDQLCKEEKISRWSPEVFILFSDAFKSVNKEHVIHALTMFDFLYMSRSEDELFGTIALDVLHIDDPARWRFRHTTENGSAAVIDDWNYLSVSASTATAIGALIADKHKLITRIRNEDVRFRVSKYENQKRATYGFGLPDKDGTTYTRMNRYTGGLKQELPVLIYEFDAGSTAKKPPMQCSVLIEFFENRFGFKIDENTPAEIRAAIRRSDPRMDAATFRANPEGVETLAALREMTQCTPTRAPLVASIMRVLNMPTLEKSPYEHPDLAPLPPAMFRYWTFYAPDDVHLDFEDGSSTRVPVDGTCMFITGVRSPEGRVLMTDNFVKPLPTARASLYKIPPNVKNAERLKSVEMARGTYYDEFDPDHFDVDTVMRRTGHPGVPLFHKLYIKALVHRRDKVRYPNERAFKRDLFDAMPLLDPKSGVPLPFAFPPITHAIEQYLATQVYKWPQFANYPECNLQDRLEDTVERTFARKNNNSNNAYRNMSALSNFNERAQIAAMRRAGEISDSDSEDGDNESVTAAHTPDDGTAAAASTLPVVPATPRAWPPATPRSMRKRTRPAYWDDSDNDDDGTPAGQPVAKRRRHHLNLPAVDDNNNDAMDIDTPVVSAASRLVPHHPTVAVSDDDSMDYLE